MQTSNTLAKTFHALGEYASSSYRLLPFKFLRLTQDRYFLSNIAGEYIVLGSPSFEQLITGDLRFDTDDYNDLKARNFIQDEDDSLALELLATQYRTKNAALAEFTALHIFVVTLRCDHSCQYCQVSRVSEDRAAFDMSEEAAERAVALMFKSPSRALKVEFQGGEPLLNFAVIRFIVERVIEQKADREVQFVIATNLSFLSPAILEFAQSHGITFSCSLDGPEDLHNGNRPRPNKDSYERAVRGIRMVREALGHDAVSALMTTTRQSLDQPEAIIDEYVKQGFDSVFLRWISPFGFAVRTSARIGYDTEKFLEFYRRGLHYIMELNLRGTKLREEYASIILRKMLTPYGNGYVDLQSPAGLGLSVLVYNYDGDVYASDEARMLAEMGDKTFRLGNVHEDTYEQLFFESSLLETVLDTTVEALPGCTDCAFTSYCGTDPVFNHATQGNIFGHRPTSSFCRRNMAIIRHLVDLLEANDERSEIIRSWAQ